MFEYMDIYCIGKRLFIKGGIMYIGGDGVGNFGVDYDSFNGEIVGEGFCYSDNVWLGCGREVGVGLYFIRFKEVVLCCKC